MKYHNTLSTAALASLIAAQALTAQRQSANPQPAVPDVVLNEVMFDPQGNDSDCKWGSEWVELYVNRPTDLAQWSLRDNNGNLIAALPSVQIPAQTYVQILLGGLAAYELDDDPTDGRYSLTLGLALADHLPNAQNAGEGGGLRLRQNGVLRDELYWGNGAAPPGSGGRFVDVSFASGIPLNEGDTLGRAADPIADYSATLADWDRNGGANAAGPTPAERNGVYPTDADDILKWSQAGVCEIINAWLYMTDQEGSIQFTGASVANVSTVIAGGVLEVTADHQLAAVVGGGTIGAIAGTLVARLEKDEAAGNVGYSLFLTGVMTCTAGWSMDIDYAKDLTGFHTNAITGATATSVVYSEDGVDYPFSNTVVRTMTRTGEHTWQMTDSRSGSDYGGAGVKTSAATTYVTRHGDGDYESHFDMTRDMPIGMPKPGEAPEPAFQQRLVIEGRSQHDDLGAGTSEITRYDEYEDGALVAELASGETGSSSMIVTGASASEPYGSSTYSLDLPLVIDGKAGNVTASVRGEIDVQNGVLLESGQGQVNVNGFAAVQFSIFADPPISVDDGCSCGGGGGGFGDAAVNCAAKGGAIGAGVGTAVGGTAGAIGGGTVGGAVTSVGGPPGVVAGMAAGGVKGAAVGAAAGATAGGLVGGGVGAAACMAGYGAKKLAGKAKSGWRKLKSAWSSLW